MSENIVGFMAAVSAGSGLMLVLLGVAVSNDPAITEGLLCLILAAILGGKR